MNVLIADDHPLFRDALVLLLADLLPDAKVSPVGSYAALLENAKQQQVDLIIADLHMPDMEAWQGVRQLRELLPDIPYIIISASEEAEDARQAQLHGAAGFIPKTLDSKGLINALQLILEQGIQIMPRTAQERSSESKGENILTPRQMEVLRCLADGDSNKHIARRLDLTEGTVKLHVRAIIHALGARNRTQAVVEAEKRGLLTSGEA